MSKGEPGEDGELPVITGHAGSIRCVAIVEKLGVVLSGSYDTSIRYVGVSHCKSGLGGYSLCFTFPLYWFSKVGGMFSQILPKYIGSGNLFRVDRKRENALCLSLTVFKFYQFMLQENRATH